LLPLILFALFFTLLTVAVVSARGGRADSHLDRWDPRGASHGARGAETPKLAHEVNASGPSSYTFDHVANPPADYVPRTVYEEAQRKSWKRLKRAVRAERRRNDLRATLLHRGSVAEAINLACATYGNCSTLWRRARCESQLNPSAHNGSEASGLLQFLPSTWRSTPYARFSIWSPYAQTLAAGWMFQHGRSSEWACR